MRTLLGSSIAVGSALLAALPATAQTDPLPAWNEGAAKQAIVKFVEDATREGGTGFVPAAERIAVFDNDGTLWSEQPVYFQMAFAIDQVKLMAPMHPEWTTEEPFKSLIAGDVKGALAQGEKAILQMMAVTHTGMTTDEFSHTVAQWAATAKHPRSGRLYTEMVFQPMLEVLTYLRANGFKTYIVSGGGIEFMRPWVERVYGIPPEQVVGSSGVTKFDLRSTGPVLLKEAKVEFIDDGPGKPVGINRFIGRRPVLAFGNSDGDQQMLQWTAGGSRRRFIGIVHHTDAKREWAYDRQSQIGKLDKALDEAKAKGWTVVDMQKDWKRIYPYDQ
jgi:phosphoserine phosphatase